MKTFVLKPNRNITAFASRKAAIRDCHRYFV